MTKKTTAIAKTGPAALDVPDFIKRGDARGSENISSEDLQLPRLALAQQMSPELDASDPKHIDGLAVGDAFNTLTRENYGKDPLRIVVVRVEKARYVEFNPREEGGGVKDFNVPKNDPRTKFGKAGDKPVATKFLEFVVMLANSMEPAALSFKGSGLKAARSLNGLITLQQTRAGSIPVYGLMFDIEPTMTSNAHGKFAVFSIKPAGSVQDKALYETAESLFESIADREMAAPSDDAEADEEAPF